MVCNTAFNAVCTLTGLTVGQVIGDSAAWSLASRRACETRGVARHSGALLSMEDAAGYARRHGGEDCGFPHLHNGRPRRRPAIDELNGAVVRLSAAAGSAAPANRAVTQLIKARESGFGQAALGTRAEASSDT